MSHVPPDPAPGRGLGFAVAVTDGGSKESLALRAMYLTGERVYLRALTKADAATSVAWRHSPFPLAQFAAEKELEEAHASPWAARQLTYAICRVADDTIVGSVKLGLWSSLRTFITVHIDDTLAGRDAGAYGAEALRLVVPWQAQENERPIIIALAPAWDAALIAAAESLGMERMVRFRQHAIHNGERHDMLLYQYIRPDWSARFTHA